MPYVNNQPQNKPKRLKKIIIIGGVLIASVALIVSWIVFAKSAEAPAVQDSFSRPTVDRGISRVEATYLFSGTVVPARAVENEARRADGTIDYNQPLSKLSTFEPEQYDEWVVDMECPVTDANIPYQEQVANTIFNCRPEFLKPMSTYFTIMNLANNHVYDRGADKFPQMQQYIQDAGIQYLGNQDPSEEKDVCEVMAISVHLIKEDGPSTDGTLPIAFCAWHYFEREPYDGEIAVMNKYAEVMPVIGLMQVGQEYQAAADERQERVGRAIIDGGAEFVIGNSPHWVQNSDVYQGKLVFYSTGNFIFDQLDEETNRGASIEVQMTVPYDDNVSKWLELGKTCEAHYDDCLSKAKEQGLTKIDPEFSFDLIASTTGYREITQKAPEAVQRAVEQRANWQKTLQELGQQ